jgi:hypothetical protein
MNATTSVPTQVRRSLLLFMQFLEHNVVISTVQCKVPVLYARLGSTLGLFGLINTKKCFFCYEHNIIITVSPSVSTPTP